MGMGSIFNFNGFQDLSALVQPAPLSPASGGSAGGGTGGGGTGGGGAGVGEAPASGGSSNSSAVSTTGAGSSSVQGVVMWQDVHPYFQVGVGTLRAWVGSRRGCALGVGGGSYGYKR